MHPFLDLPSPRLEDAILSLGPTAYWPLDDSSGALRDAVSNRYPASVTGSPTYGVAAPFGRGVTFSGTGQYASSATSVPTPTSAITVGILMRTTNTAAADRTLFARRIANQATWQIILPSSNAPYGAFLQSTGTAHCQVDMGTGAANDGNWHLLIATFDGTTATGYRDAQTAVVNTTLSGSWYTASTAGIGIASNSTGALGLFPGTLAHAFMIHRAISDAERRWLSSVAFGG